MFANQSKHKRVSDSSFNLEFPVEVSGGASRLSLYVDSDTRQSGTITAILYDTRYGFSLCQAYAMHQQQKGSSNKFHNKGFNNRNTGLEGYKMRCIDA